MSEFWIAYNYLGLYNNAERVDIGIGYHEQLKKLFLRELIE